MGTLLTCYTDGSMMNGKVGARVYIPALFGRGGGTSSNLGSFKPVQKFLHIPGFSEAI